MWVDAEVAFFKEHGRADRVLALLVEGDPATAFPQSLYAIRGDVSPQRIAAFDQPLAANVNTPIDEWPWRRRNFAKLRLLATMLGCRFDDLRRRELERRLRRSALIGSVVAVVASVITAAVIYGVQQSHSAAQREAEAHVEEALRRGANNEALARLNKLPATFANAARLTRAVENGVAWPLVVETSRNTRGAIAWSPDSRSLVWGGDDDLVHIFDVSTGLSDKVGTNDPVYRHIIEHAAWSPDGHLVAVQRWTGNVELWRRAAGSLERKPTEVIELGGRGRPGQKSGIAWNRSAMRIAVVVPTEAIVWDLKEGRRVARSEFDPPYHFAWSRDASRLLRVTPSADLEVWHSETNTTVALSDAKLKWISTAAWSPDGKRIALGTLDNELRLAELCGTKVCALPNKATVKRRLGPREVELDSPPPESRKPEDVETMMSFEGRLRLLEWSPSGTEVAYLIGGSVGWWTFDDYAFELPHEDATVVAWAPDGKRLAVGLKGGDIYIWRPQTANRSPEVVLRGQTGAGIVSLAWAPNSRALASVTETGPLQIWDTHVALGRIVQAPTRYTKRMESYLRNFDALAWSRNGSHLLSHTTNNEIAFLNVAAGQTELIKASGFAQGAHTRDRLFSMTSDGTLVAYVTEAGDVSLFDVATNRHRRIFGVQGDLQSIAWSPDRRTLAVATESSIWLWSTDSQKPREIRVENRLQAIAWASDSRRLAIGRRTGQVDILDEASPKSQIVRPAAKQARAINGLYWAPHEQIVVIGNSGIELWDPKSSTCVRADNWTECSLVEYAKVYSWSPDGTEIAFADARSDVKGKASRPSITLRVGQLSQYSINAMAWSPDSKYLATQGEPNTIRVWDLKSNLSLVFGHADGIRSLAWSADGLLASSASDGAVRTWPSLWQQKPYADVSARGANLEVTPQGTIRPVPFRGLPWMRPGN